MPRIAILVLIALIVRSASGNSGPPPPLTSATLAGVWEGMAPASDIVFQFVVEPSGRGCFVFIRGDTDEIYRLVSAKVAHGKVTLRFDNTQKQELVDDHYVRTITLRGTGVGNSIFGVISGKIEGAPKGSADWINAQLSFTRPPWLQDAARYSKRTKRLLEKVRARSGAQQRPN